MTTKPLPPVEPASSVLAHRLRQAVERNRKAYLTLLRGVPGWDRLILTATNDAQADSYREELAERRALGLLPPSTQAQVVTDPPGERPGSGGATFQALREAGYHPGERVLLFHCGGESRRLPAYGPQGKLFAPLPCPRPDGRASTVFDEILVSLSPLGSRMEPGWLIAAADILLLFHSARVTPKPGAVTGLSFATDAQTALGHGIYLPGRHGEVAGFLQKPTLNEADDAGMLRPDGSALVDTGVFVYHDEALRAFDALSRTEAGHRPSDMYLDWVLPMVPSVTREAYLSDGDTALREPLWDALRPVPLAVKVADPSRFVHLGSTAQWRETLLSDPVTAHALGFQTPFRSHLDDEETPSGALVLNSIVTRGPGPSSDLPGDHVAIETGAVVEACFLGENSRIGRDAVAVGVNDALGRLHLPAGLAVDQLPVTLDDGGGGWVTRVYPVQMDPKATGDRVMFFGLPAGDWLRHYGLPASEVWGDAASPASEPPSAACSLWNARLFPVASTPDESLERAMWLLESARMTLGDAPPRGLARDGRYTSLPAWRDGFRLSFEECQRRVDRSRLREYRRDLDEQVMLAQARHALDHDGDARLLRPAAHHIPLLRELLAEDLNGERGAMKAARAHWLLADLLKTLDEADLRRVRRDAVGTRGAFGTAADHQERAFAEISQAINLAVDTLVETPRWNLAPDESVAAEAPIRVDFAGAWSDTPPYTLEHGGANLNVALLLDGRRPLRAAVRRLEEPVLRLRSLDLGAEVTITRRAEALRYTDPRDPFALTKAALSLLGIVTPDGGALSGQLKRFGGGLEVTTESAVPKGSGLGTSSILGGVVLAALARTMGVELDGLSLFEPVLALEQRLTTGGGWQDQIGGLTGGWKITTTEPGLRQVPSVRAFRLGADVERAVAERTLLMYSGYARLAKGILRNIVGEYLSRNADTLRVLHGIRPHTERMLAHLLTGHLDAVGAQMDASTEFVARIDPNSYPAHIAAIVDAVRPFLSGAKPTGAGGGGFLVMMARSAEDRRRAEETLARLDLPDGARVYPLEVDPVGLRIMVSRPQV